MKRYIRAVEPVDSATGEGIKELSKFVDKAFSGANSLFKRIGEWSREYDDSEDSEDSTESKPQSPFGTKQILEIPTEIPRDGGGTYTFRMLMKCTGTSDGYAVFDFFFKEKGADSNAALSEKGLKFEVDEDETEREFDDRLQKSLSKIISSFIRRFTNNKYDSFDADDIKVIE